MKKIIPRAVHALLDYSWSSAIVAAPRLLGFADESNARRLCTVQGTAVTLASLLTRYELGALKLIPFRTHLKANRLGALAGLSTPWLLGFAHNKTARNTVLAFFLMELVVVMLSRDEEMDETQTSS